MEVKDSRVCKTSDVLLSVLKRLLVTCSLPPHRLQLAAQLLLLPAHQLHLHRHLVGVVRVVLLGCGGDDDAVVKWMTTIRMRARKCVCERRCGFIYMKIDLHI